MTACCGGRNYVTIRLFCEGLSLCPRTHSFRRNDCDMLVFCFADRVHAQQFASASAATSLTPSLGRSGQERADRSMKSLVRNRTFNPALSQCRRRRQKPPYVAS